MKMLTINVEGWPERLVRMVESFVATFGRPRHAAPHGRPPDLPRWPDVSLPPEKLRRVEIYRDAR